MFLRFCVLGPLEVSDGDRVLAVGAGRERALLALLLVHAGEVVSRDRLIDELWSGAPPPSASQSLDTLVSRLRRALRTDAKPAPLVTRAPGYVLDEVDIDARNFEDAVQAARDTLAAGERKRGASMLRDALALWRGRAYAEVADEPWARDAADRLEALRLAAIEDRNDAELELGLHAALVPDLSLLVARHPTRERLAGQLVLALYRCGRQADALDAYGSTRASLVEGFGLEPGPELRALQAAVLAQDKDLRLPASPISGPVPGHLGPPEVPPAAPAAPSAPSLPRVLASFAGEPLVGREDELEAVREVTAFERARQALLVLGEPGIGKTRLAAAAAELAQQAGAVVVLARCPPDPSTAFEPWVRALGEVALDRDGPGRAQLATAAGAELSALVPELAGLVPARAAGASTDTLVAEGARYRVLRGVGEALAHAAGDRPVCVVLDDAHWCDPASAQVLGELLERAPFSQLVLIVTARDRDLGRGHPVTRALTELKRTRELRELRLDGLDASGLAALVSARVGRAITPGLAARLLRRTHGNPFFAGELVRDLDDRDALHDTMLDSAPVPDAVAGLVDERLARLHDRTARFLVAAAAIGPTVSVALAATAAGLDQEHVSAAVAEAVAERLVDETPAQAPTVTFPHALVREALASLPAPADAARLHHRIAQALAAEPDAEPAELARHRALAAPITGTEPAMAAHRDAAAAAAAGHDHEAAAAHLDQVLALMPRSGERGRLLLELGDQHILAVDMRRARTAYAAAADAARAHGNARLLARAALGFAGGEVGFNWEQGIDDPQVTALLREALTTLDGGERTLELGVIFRLLYMTALERGEHGRAALVGRATRLAAGRDDALTQLQLGAIRFASAFAWSSDPLDAMGDPELLGRARRARRAGRPRRLAAAHPDVGGVRRHGRRGLRTIRHAHRARRRRGCATRDSAVHVGSRPAARRAPASAR